MSDIREQQQLRFDRWSSDYLADPGRALIGQLCWNNQKLFSPDEPSLQQIPDPAQLLKMVSEHAEGSTLLPCWLTDWLLLAVNRQQHMQVQFCVCCTAAVIPAENTVETYRYWTFLSPRGSLSFKQSATNPGDGRQPTVNHTNVHLCKLPRPKIISRRTANERDHLLGSDHVISDRTANESYGKVGEKKRSRREKTEWSCSSPESAQVC